MCEVTRAINASVRVLVIAGSRVVAVEVQIGFTDLIGGVVTCFNIRLGMKDFYG